MPAHRPFCSGVVIGFDDACAAGPQWSASANVASLPHGADQPFYHVLVDSRDARRNAAPRYVPQDEVAEVLSLPEAAALAGGPPLDAASAARALVLHPDAAQHFAAYCPGAGRFVPGARLEAAYAEDAAAAAAVVAALRRWSDADCATASAGGAAGLVAPAGTAGPASRGHVVLGGGVGSGSGAATPPTSGSSGGAGGSGVPNDDSGGAAVGPAPRRSHLLH